MNTHLMHTEFPTTGQPIRVVIIDGEPWFVVADVCKVLGHSNPRKAAAMVSGGLTIPLVSMHTSAAIPSSTS